MELLSVFVWKHFISPRNRKYLLDVAERANRMLFFYCALHSMISVRSMFRFVVMDVYSEITVNVTLACEKPILLKLTAALRFFIMRFLQRACCTWWRYTQTFRSIYLTASFWMQMQLILWSMFCHVKYSLKIHQCCNYRCVSEALKFTTNSFFGAFWYIFGRKRKKLKKIRFVRGQVYLLYYQ